MPQAASDQAGQANALLEQLNPMIFGADSRLKLKYVNFEDVREQDINANVMPAGMFNALVSNVQKSAQLESVPLCATREETPNVIEVVSGHHRIRAAKQAGVRGGVVLLYEGLTNSEIRAKQLAHNSISGNSDPEIVKEIFGQIEDLSDRLESFIDPNVFNELPKAMKFDMVDVDPLADAKTVTIVFLPTQVKDFQTALDVLTSDPDIVYVAHREAFDAFRDAVHRTREEMEIVSYPTALAAMARLAVERLAQMRAEQDAAESEAREEGREPPPPPAPAVAMDPDLIAALGR
jgi:hypothetical protein